LAALLALELRADLLILLSDVEGLYTGPPSEPKSQLIHTYLKEKHDDMVTFGEKSRVGRGGMTAKVYAAWNAASAGIPVVITSGYAPESLQRVVHGDHIGTLFHKDAHLWVDMKETGARDMAVSARDASRRLQSLSSEERQQILLRVAEALVVNEERINAENEADVDAAQLNGIAKSLIGRLTIKPGKIASLANSLRVLSEMKDPIGAVTKRTEIADGLILEKTTCPLGVVLVIFESRPDALVQVISQICGFLHCWMCFAQFQ
jgi:delta-1-pyrroline-5-carboxylate synthetase